MEDSNNKYFIGGIERNSASSNETSTDLDKIRQLLKRYLELDNVNFLFGTGSSIPLGAATIGDIPQKVESDIAVANLKEYFEETISKLQNSSSVVRWKNESDEEQQIDYPLEKLLNFLTGKQFLYEQLHKSDQNLTNLITTIKKSLFALCDLDNSTLSKKNNPHQSECLDSNRYFFHEKFIKKILQRPLNLRRANIFTTNYDLVFERAFDSLGVYYIDGFVGFHNRTFRPESFDYDMYYPGATTQGKVHRLEKVLRYYKIHGSLSWINVDPSASNIYGIQELPVEMIKENDAVANIIIYPCATKKSYTLDFPFSELLRHFASAITQSQTVLFCIGYSFNDEHINDIVYQALSIPSFTLIIVDYKGIVNPEINRLNNLKDPRIIILQGPEYGEFLNFSENILPDLVEIKTDELVAETLRKLHENKNSQIDPINDVITQAIPGTDTPNVEETNTPF